MRQCFQGEKRSDHVFSDSLCFFLAFGLDLAVHIETCCRQRKILLHKFEIDESFVQ